MIEDNNNNADADQSTSTSTATSTATGATTTATGGGGGGANWSEVQDTVSRLSSHKGVLAVSILNSEGDIVTQQITSAGTARAAAASASQQNSSSDVSSSSSSSNNVLGNPKLLIQMMKNANLYVQSLSGHAYQDSNSNSNSSNNEEQQQQRQQEEEVEQNEGQRQPRKSKNNKNPLEDISFVRIRTQRDEILIAPKLGYTLIALHDPTISSL
jgi:hypothetical protein